ncbi:hypothetical protein [Mesorhizobium australicum]|uniref:TNase-like domain-containing protein n=1 Tax=Mesorhizobium australicum TaxID=536018 RepID=A0A1X7NRW0_9HYPH|nr:hypothetical protein [Mesorhizobium australicum]SMH40780.1 hypothetical protein SAMN02982922_2421 [Mesorhizobium australicum]
MIRFSASAVEFYFIVSYPNAVMPNFDWVYRSKHGSWQSKPNYDGRLNMMACGSSENSMRNNTLITAITATMLFGIAMTYMVSRANQYTTKTTPPIPSEPLYIEGRLSIESVEDLSVAGHRIRLCGVAFVRAVELRPLVLEAMKREFEGKTVTCRQVGAGTPCDGRSAPSFQRSSVMQCFIGETDVAQALAERKLLCDVAALSGGRYPGC